MPNSKKEISKHNHTTLQNSSDILDDDMKLCNCRIKSNCPVNGKFLTEESFLKLRFRAKIRNIFTKDQLEENSSPYFTSTYNLSKVK